MLVGDRVEVVEGLFRRDIGVITLVEEEESDICYRSSIRGVHDSRETKIWIRKMDVRVITEEEFIALLLSRR